MQFEFATGRIIFGAGSVNRLPELLGSFGSRTLLVTGSSPERFASLLPPVAAIFAQTGEPTLHSVRDGVRVGREAKCDHVVGIGGGSAIDAAKAIAALLPNSGEPLDYLEVIGKGQAFQAPGLPIIAVPTTAGTGAEVTRNSVVGSPEHGLKASLRGPSLLPALALVDPQLTLTLSREATATTGLDALTQLLEAFVSRRANAFTDALCRDGFSQIRLALRSAYQDGANPEAREQTSYASLLSGLALANAGLGVVHGFAAPLGGLLKASHGSICAAVLVEGCSANINALSHREPNHPSLNKYGEAAQLLTGAPQADVADLLHWMRQLTHDLGIRRLASLGLQQSQIPELVGKAAKANSMKANPIDLSPDELTAVAQHSY